MGDTLEEQLLALFQSLSPTDQAALLSFAGYLASRSGAQAVPETPPPSATPVPEPEPIPRPDDEKVVAAIKRLSRSYPMLDKSKMLGVTSDLMTQHILQGRDAGAVIDELERLFREEYDRLKQARD